MKFDKNRLIGKYLSGNASPEEKKRLMDWVHESHENLNELNSFKKLWDVSASLKKGKKDDVKKAWSTFQEIVHSETPVKKLYVHPLKLAAVLALCISTVFLVIYFLPGPDKEMIVVQQNTYIQQSETVSTVERLDTMVAAPQYHAPLKKAHQPHAKLISTFTWTSSDTVNVFILPDGSKVHLNRFSRITYTRSGRTVSLEGEAFFEVKPDSIPFYVTCKNTVTRALGTCFNVKGSDRDETVEVTAVVGSVDVSDKFTSSNSMQLNEGEIVSCNDQHTFVKLTGEKKEGWWKRNSFRDKIKRFFNKIRRHKSE